MDREYFKRQLDQRAKDSEFKKAREELVWLKSFCHHELQGMIHKVGEEVRLQNIALGKKSQVDYGEIISKQGTELRQTMDDMQLKYTQLLAIRDEEANRMKGTIKLLGDRLEGIQLQLQVLENRAPVT